ncbi:unnamed protein product [Gemmata massiliana]|uniref:SPOR domain-containing protein n=1 Tax=Gemmata massiliana TaxID=1210884 RepID=A0A6P2DCC6_9BACT|nr:hypothetical protein [Gemmata massiliana]VTR99135.1 unnamed protein product [Gemmata massiliana]
MIRKLVLGAVAATAIGFGTQTATAGEPFRGPVGPSNGGVVPPHQRHDHDYVVFVKRGHFGHWERYGRYETRREAERVERFLESRGHRARIEVVEDRRRPW